MNFHFSYVYSWFETIFLVERGEWLQFFINLGKTLKIYESLIMYIFISRMISIDNWMDDSYLTDVFIHSTKLIYLLLYYATLFVEISTMWKLPLASQEYFIKYCLHTSANDDSGPRQAFLWLSVTVWLSGFMGFAIHLLRGFLSMGIPILFAAGSGRTFYGVFYSWLFRCIQYGIPGKFLMGFSIYGYFDTFHGGSRANLLGVFYSWLFR